MFLAVIIITFTTLTIPGMDIKLIKKVKLSQDTTILEKVQDFCLTEDELFLIPDSKAGNIKIYENNGKLVKTLGRSGLGPNEFLKPTYCFYNKKEEFQFGILDARIKKIFLYQRTGKLDFKRSKETLCLTGGYSLKKKGNVLLISGFKRAPNGNAYDLYSIDLMRNQTSFLLPSHHKYGLKSFEEYDFQYKQRPDISTIGISGWFDIQGTDVYFVWYGDLKIIKMNIDSGTLNFFGEKTPHYIKPSASKQMIEAYRAGDFKVVKNEKTKMSYVRNIFASPKHVLLVYEGPTKKEGVSNVWVQFYTLAGKFLQELPVPCQPESLFYFDKDKSMLYALGIEADAELNEENIMLVYKVTE